MMIADSLHVAMHLIVPSSMPFRLLPPCCRACSAGAFAPRLAQHPAQASSVQASCLERARPAAFMASVRAFAGALAASSTAPTGHRRPERQRGAKAEGKIKGRGTPLRERPVCTWGWRGTRLVAAPCRVDRQCLAGIEESASLARLASTALDGGTP
ncbi:hypothetical protein DYL61_25830 [Pseudomonas nabeulensis]|uniref:Uncharacterized protein n=1 Tax=Pseudomonas nabeulensis TaxID=2293833 RepID=A0A4Z0AMY8_9PSED|nr:hypothetical protein DYL61_25830 [Pseudomonas nabeulensis]